MLISYTYFLPHVFVLNAVGKNVVFSLLSVASIMYIDFIRPCCELQALP